MKRLKRPSPSMAVALLALVISLGGTATAAVVITSTGQIKDGAVKRPDLAKDVINTSRIQNGSVTPEDLRSDARSAGPLAYEAFRASGPTEIGPDQKATVATLDDLPAGAYSIFAKTVLTAPSNSSAGLIGQGQSVGGHCELDAMGDTDNSYALLGAPGALAPATISTQITRTFAGTGSAKLVCDVTKETWRAGNTSIIAIRLGKTPTRTNVGD